MEGLGGPVESRGPVPGKNVSLFQASGVCNTHTRSVGFERVNESGGYLAVFVERERHDAISRPESLLYTVPMVYVDVDVKDARVVPQELQNREYDVVDIAEAGGLGLLGMMQPAGPVDCNEGLVVREFTSRVEGSTSVEGCVGVESVENGAVFANVEAAVVGSYREVVGGGSMRRD